MKQKAQTYGVSSVMELYSVNDTPAQYLWQVSLQIEQVTSELPASVETTLVQIAHGGPAGPEADWEALVFPSCLFPGGILQLFRSQSMKLCYYITAIFTN